jgi:hypothetical protein
MANKNLKNALSKLNQFDKMQSADVIVLSPLSANAVKGGAKGGTCTGTFTCSGGFSCNGTFTCSGSFSASAQLEA